jgi:hypothetical protein
VRPASYSVLEVPPPDFSDQNILPNPASHLRWRRWDRASRFADRGARGHCAVEFAGSRFVGSQHGLHLAQKHWVVSAPLPEPWKLLSAGNLERTEEQLFGGLELFWIEGAASA